MKKLMLLLVLSCLAHTVINGMDREEDAAMDISRSAMDVEPQFMDIEPQVPAAGNVNQAPIAQPNQVFPPPPPPGQERYFFNR